MTSARRRLSVALALMLVPAGLHAGDDKKLPKRPDRPLAVAVRVLEKPGAPAPDAKTQKEIQDSIEDVLGSLRGKRKDWFTVVDDPGQAEILLEIEGRGFEQNHGAVLRGQVRVLNLEPFPIIGQGALNPGGWSFKYWREASGDMAGRLQTYCQKTYDSIVEARKSGFRPIAVAANDRGIALMRKDDAAGALASFDEAIRLAPGFALPHFNRGLVLSIQKDWPGSRAAFDAAVQLDPKYQRALYYRAESRRETGDLPGARADLDEAVRLDPKHADAWYDRGSVLASLGEHKAAIEDYDQAATLAPKLRGKVLARQGQSWERLGDTERALAAYSAAAASGYEDAALHYNRGRLLAAAGDEAKACTAFTAAAGLDAKDPAILFERGVCRAKRGQTAQAIEDFSECIRLSPEMAPAYYNRGLCYTKQGKVKLAAADKARALKLDPKIASRK
jgi:tetratricopeptide (TPR) repeat protein